MDDDLKKLGWVAVITLLCLTFLVLISGSSVAAPVRDLFFDDSAFQGTRVLFIGNSYTYYNDLPDLFTQLAREGGYEVVAASRTPGGWSLEDHAQSKWTLDKLDDKQWDYVILQEQSVRSALPVERDLEMYPAVRSLDQQIEVLGGETILFMTWGRRDGLPEAGFGSYDEMQSAVAVGYDGIAGELDILIAPVGLAWQKALEEDPQLDLWQEDASHPNRKGSYLAACVFYAVIFQESPAGLSYRSGLDGDMAFFLQTVAAETVFE